ncbi:MAG: SMP-30/Gluconolaconase/LRE-like region [Phycisphaerales bacterium]|nr:SMP-30/Gluconolaconase/LRE-like region [Phycisphaerales bacterium]
MKLGIARVLAFGVLSISASFPASAEEAKVTHRVLAQDKGHVVILNEKGEVEWEAPCKSTSHDIALLPGGNYLIHMSDTKIVEMTPDKKVVWQHESKPTDPKKGVQIHAFQRLANGNTMVSESGNARIIEVDKDDKIVKEMKLTVEHPSTHSDTRLVRKLENGHYLVAHENDGAVREYDEAGKVVWTHKIGLADRPAANGHGVEGHGDHVYSAYRLPSGNTLIGCGNGNRVIEVTPEGKTVWSVEQKELPGITLAWVTMLQVLPNGNVVIGNCHAGPENPQLIEVTRDKKVVWTLKDFKNLGNATAASQLLGVEGNVIR